MDIGAGLIKLQPDVLKQLPIQFKGIGKDDSCMVIGRCIKY